MKKRIVAFIMSVITIFSLLPDPVTACAVYEYVYAGPGSSYHPTNDVQAIMIGELTVTRELYDLIIKKVDSTDSNRGLAGAVIKITGVDNDFTGT